MPRKPRIDAPFLLHHVCNRGLAKRGVFENGTDVGHFLQCLERVATEGEVEVLAFCVLTTHFHLLVRSLEPGLSHALQRVEQRYVQHFNRTRGRDGPLFKDRFFSRPLESHTDFRLVIRYIDENAVGAGLVERAIDYPHGSAFWYSRPAGPGWLARTVIEREVCGDAGPYRPAMYHHHFGWKFTPAQRSLVESRMLKRRTGVDSLDDLVLAAPPVVRRWLEERARLADRVPLTELIVAPTSLLARLQHLQAAGSGWRVRVKRQSRCAWSVAKAGLLRVACGLTHEEIGDHLGLSTMTARALIRSHRLAMTVDCDYADRAARLLADLLRDDLSPAASRSEGTPTPK